LNIFWKSK